jgi:hypothetical protein
MNNVKITGPDDATEAVGVLETATSVVEKEVEFKVATPLSSLKSRRAELVNKLWTDIRVPRWENPSIFVRVKPIDPMFLNDTLKKRSEGKLKDWPQRANADILFASCVGVYQVYDESPDDKLSLREGDPYGAWTKFDTDLTDALGIDPGTTDQTVQAVRGLFIGGDGDLDNATAKLLTYSNIGNAEADTTF